MLSTREITVAKYYAKGQTYKQIARELSIAPATIRNHLASIYHKLGINNKAELIHCLPLIIDSGKGGKMFEPGTPAASVLQILDDTILQPVSNPSVAVLPFQNIGPEDKGYFCQGVTVNIHNNLTRFPDLFVSGRSSCLAINHIADDSDEVSLNLGVQYLVKGTVRIHNNTARITSELIDSVSGAVLWSDQFERQLEHILAVETEIANTIAGNLSIRLETAQYERRHNLSVDQLTAYDWQLRGYHSLEQGGAENLRQANLEFTEALKLDSKSAGACAGLSMTYCYECDQLLAENYSNSLEQHVRLADKAVALDESDSRGHYAKSCAHSWKGQFELADQHAKRALELNPSEYHNLCNRGYTLMSLDSLEGSIDCFSESLRRNPLAPTTCLFALGLIEYFESNYVQSATAFSRMSPTYLQRSCSLAAAYGQLGYDTDAKSAASEFRRNVANRSEYQASKSNSDWQLFWSKVYPHLGPDGFQQLTVGLDKAGLPIGIH